MLEKKGFCFALVEWVGSGQVDFWFTEAHVDPDFFFSPYHRPNNSGFLIIF